MRWCPLATEQRSSRLSRSTVPFTRTTGAASGPLFPTLPAMLLFSNVIAMVLFKACMTGCSSELALEQGY